MKIPNKIINAYRKYDWGCANDNWNIANGKPTNEQRYFLNEVYSATYGICGDGRLKIKDVKNYRETHGLV